MRFCLVAALLVPAAFVRAGEDSPESLSRDMLALLQETKPVLAAIKDRKTAETAKPKLAELGKRFMKLMEREAALEKAARQKKPSAEPTAKQRKDLEKVSADVFGEMDRIAGMAEAMQVLRGDTLLSYHARMQKARRDRARIDVLTLQRALDAHAIRTGDYPPSLETLTQKQPNGTRPILEPRSLIDPWGRPYVYEPNTRDPGTNRPLIYSHGPRPGDPAGRIRNWPAPEKK
jgi:hypothetical protein